MLNNDIRFVLGQDFYHDLIALPWYKPLEDWNDKEVKFVDYRKGISRHPVRFISSKKFSYAIKQTSESTSVMEIQNYHQLLQLGIHTLTPVGYITVAKPPIVIESKLGITYQKDELSFVVTLLEDKALPDSYLFKLKFKEENNKLILDAVAELFAQLHLHNVYWGDASLANMLIRFVKIRDEKGRTKTVLKAVLADTETVKFVPDLSKEMIRQDIEYFFETMEWMNEDFKAAGMVNVENSVAKDIIYIENAYSKLQNHFLSLQSFKKETGLDVRMIFGQINDAGTLEYLLGQINEHKWYLSEKSGEEIALNDAAKDWLETIYYPIIDEFDKMHIFEFFPFLNATSLYLEIMTHKYYMSQSLNKNVNIGEAITDYSKKFGNEADNSHGSFFTRIGDILNKILHRR